MLRGSQKVSPKNTLCLQMRHLQTTMKICDVYSPPFAEEAAQALGCPSILVPRVSSFSAAALTTLTRLQTVSHEQIKG